MMNSFYPKLATYIDKTFDNKHILPKTVTKNSCLF